MLFHLSFYSNKQPAVPACSHAHSVEFGEYHLSKVKFPGKVAEQSRLTLSELVLRSLRLGLNAARTNLLPALLVQLLMGAWWSATFICRRPGPSSEFSPIGMSMEGCSLALSQWESR